MSFRLRNQSLEREVHRVARIELEGALKEMLTEDAQSRSTAVHEARKHIKRIRALIRLLRPAVGDAFYKRENAALRTAAQRISPIRDSHVRVQTVAKLIASFRTRRPPAALARVRAAMAARLGQVLDDVEMEDWRKKTAADIERALCRLKKWPLKRLTPETLRSGLKTAWKKARRALAAARLESTDENLHKLRKGVKDLGYHLSLLGGDQPPPIKALTKRLRDLGQKLGDDHDLAMLMEARAGNPLPGPADWEKVGAAIASRRPRLQRSALRLAGNVLARKSGAFADFVIDHWISWRR